MLRRQGRHISRTFKDTAYGSAESAFEQARDYRDAIMHALPPVTLREKANCLRSDNTSGVSGVYKAHDPQPRWIAYLSSPDGVRTKGYSVSRYGDEKAKIFAIRKRQEWLADIPSAFHTVNEEAKAVARWQFPDRLNHIPSVTNSHLMPPEAIDEILTKIDQDFDARRPLRLRVTIRGDANDRLRAIVVFNKTGAQIKQISIGTRSRSLAESLSLMRSSLQRALLEFCGEPVVRRFEAGYAARLLDPVSFDRVRGSEIAMYIPRHTTYLSGQDTSQSE
ncbi:AP2 domain-containing protein [Rhizobium hainanense]|uniref:AP2 domain-containing protein n=2 Tax=Rhizobium hainanense TaxID=52131 RepID=A0A1C3WJ41_9HYPH|nr:AP2 domain-containing protein [Rhizobium hainanense]